LLCSAQSGPTKSYIFFIETPYSDGVVPTSRIARRERTGYRSNF
jgi:hypothetical protein